MSAPEIITGDCRTEMSVRGPFDMVFADPPYGDTSLTWDRKVEGWIAVAVAALKPSGSMWVFGFMRFFIDQGGLFKAAGLRYAQDVVWEKHNGSSFHCDRFKRVHEHAVQFYRADTEWAAVWNEVQTTSDARSRVVRRKKRPAHTGDIGRGHYVSEDGGPRIERSVIYARSCHGRAIHPTEKPSGFVEKLIRTSCPPGGIVGDFFAGSGSAGEAAAMSGRRYVGCEIDPEMARAARDRLAGSLFVGCVGTTEKEGRAG
ncbi:hypothetical protein IZ6_07620 [Terrihabitans soli]|uniref:Methyltransferase n=1 Tax=Terrihabitans soli TaxID=708113 RepID=A0A6S6QQ03_9HYPH|nr:site-specific DNA-methyltransferase [Terrihabitans soli]BCJ90027.1 hypothetical protein IZ6_07620 [Terrihabitans soli]